jgi:Immunity protein 63
MAKRNDEGVFFRRLFGTPYARVTEAPARRRPTEDDPRGLPLPEPGLLLPLDAVRQWVEATVACMPWPPSPGDLPVYAIAPSDRPRIEIDAAYHRVAIERGEETGRNGTRSLDELLFWVFEPVTFSIASAYAAARHEPANGYRRALFRRQLDLLGGLDPVWRERQRLDLLAILARHPLTDGGPQTID